MRDFDDPLVGRNNADTFNEKDRIDGSEGVNGHGNTTGNTQLQTSDSV